MGLCTGKFKQENDTLYSNLFKALEERNTQKLETLISRQISKNSNFDIDNRLICIRETYISLLTYALTSGNSRSFIVLVEKGKASLKQLRSDLSEIGLTPLDVICDLDLVDLLKYYMPIHMSHCQSEESYGVYEPEESLFADWNQIIEKTKTLRIQPSKTPIQNACERGSLKIVTFVEEYFRNVDTPVEFDLNHVSESTGENAALCSVKSGNLALIRFLYEIANVDFTLINKHRENAIMIACAWSKRKKTEFLPVIEYLVEIVRIDFTYEYEEALLVLNDENIIRFYEQKLAELGISDTKTLVDQRNNIQYRRSETEAHEANHKDFNFKEYYKEELEESCMSSIDYVHTHSHFLSKVFEA